jgi:hypothetical protein
MSMQLIMRAAVLRQVRNARRLIQQAGQELVRQDSPQSRTTSVRWG